MHDRELVKNCRRCNRLFSQVNRKKHCRSCGLVFCGTCSYKPMDRVTVNCQRVCITCNEHNKISPTDNIQNKENNRIDPNISQLSCINSTHKQQSSSTPFVQHVSDTVNAPITYKTPISAQLPAVTTATATPRRKTPQKSPHRMLHRRCRPIQYKGQYKLLAPLDALSMYTQQRYDKRVALRICSFVLILSVIVIAITTKVQNASRVDSTMHSHTKYSRYQGVQIDAAKKAMSAFSNEEITPHKMESSQTSIMSSPSHSAVTNVDDDDTRTEQHMIQRRGQFQRQRLCGGSRNHGVYDSFESAQKRLQQRHRINSIIRQLIGEFTHTVAIARAIVSDIVRKAFKMWKE